ncbi:unnamed protein product [Symbiodinium sp. CCMP2592]|nr:unnamed protein product [Symbiodinium sp. CCMP2592]
MAAPGDASQPPAHVYPDTPSDSEWQPIHASSCASQEAPGPTAAFAQPCPSQSFQLVHQWPQWPAVAGVGALQVGEVSSSQAASSEGARSALRTASGQRKGKAERRRAMQSSQSQTCHAMKATQTDLDGPRLDRVLTQNAAYLNYIHQATRWKCCFFVIVLFMITWPLLVHYRTDLLFREALEAHKKEVLEWKVKHEECVGNLQSTSQKAQACQSNVREALEEQDKLNRTLAGAQDELRQCKRKLQTDNKAEYSKRIQDQAAQLATCKSDFSKTSGEKEQLNGTLREVQGERGQLQEALRTCKAEVKEQHEASMQCNTALAGLEDDIEIARKVDIKLSSKLADAIISQDIFKASHGSCLRELAKRADEADGKVKEWRDMRSQDLKTLYHGLHWMWKCETLDKQNKQLMETVQALEEQVKKLEASPTKEAILMFLATVFGSSKTPHTAKSQ